MTLSFIDSKICNPEDSDISAYFEKDFPLCRDVSDQLISEWKKNLRRKCHNGLQRESPFQFSGIPVKGQAPDQWFRTMHRKFGRATFNLGSGRYIGHMTSALPTFLKPLAEAIVSYNQNMVKWETSGSFSYQEQHTLGMLHQLVYGRNDSYYDHAIKQACPLGSFCSGGTVANMTALWVARNQCFPPNDQFSGIASSGLHKALQAYGYQDAVVLVSSLGHYSLSKAMDLMGMGKNQLVSIKTDCAGKTDLNHLEQTLINCRKQSVKVIAIVGVAGSTETGSVDPLHSMAKLAKSYQCHFHVDAAWGGATLLSQQNRHLLSGIELADTVTLDPHKQFYTPMGVGCILFNDHSLPESVKHEANYIIRKDSKDSGRYTLEGSRPNHSLYVQAVLSILGKQGLSSLVDQGIQKAKEFATMICNDPDFELMTEPTLNILTYRFRSEAIKIGPDELNVLNKVIQQEQAYRGLSFVSRTELNVSQHNESSRVVVFRAILANPLTTREDLRLILEEQRSLGEEFISQIKGGR